MMCPTDGNVLVMSERSGIEIDYCPECRGVWLDRGELDKIIEKVAASQPAPAAGPVPPVEATYQPAPGSYEYERDQRHQQSQHRYDEGSGYRKQAGYGQGGQGGYPQKRKKHWLNEIFD